MHRAGNSRNTKRTLPVSMYLALSSGNTLAAKRHAVAARHRGIFDDGDLGVTRSPGRDSGRSPFFINSSTGISAGPRCCAKALVAPAERKAGAGEKHAASDHGAAVEIEAKLACKSIVRTPGVIDSWTAFASRHTVALANNMGPATD